MVKDEMPPISIVMALCPECTRGPWVKCAGYEGITTAADGVSCARYKPKPNKRSQMERPHIMALPDREPCADCACRKGSTPNGTHHSMADFQMCVETMQPFLCHEGGAGRVCAGWLRAVKARGK